MEWRIGYEIRPMRGIYFQNVIANTQEGAIDFLQSLNDYDLNIISVHEVNNREG
ncbi:hypothetical protein P4V41_08025 [Fictibacillus nanhaiensis]|uniref:hypothetical protein n=1 Tax=Fictibacillus nanhaiensis TaxID=742169 RepID=UPI002E1FD3EA|nr:hypothetical protein [Fictibacillus nanhaiensis]